MEYLIYKDSNLMGGGKSETPILSCNKVNIIYK